MSNLSDNKSILLVTLSLSGIIRKNTVQGEMILCEAEPKNFEKLNYDVVI